MKNIMIRQPGYFPNIGFFKKIQSSDIFVFLNDVQFSKDSFDNRNQIKSKNNSEWITVPLKRPVFEKKLNEVLISYTADWITEHSNKILENYRSTPYFFSIVSFKIRKAIAGSVVVPDLEITFKQTSLPSINSRRSE